MFKIITFRMMIVIKWSETLCARAAIIYFWQWVAKLKGLFGLTAWSLLIFQHQYLWQRSGWDHIAISATAPVWAYPSSSVSFCRPFCVTPIRSSSSWTTLAVASSSRLFTSSFSSCKAWEELWISCEKIKYNVQGRKCLNTLRENKKV